MSPQAFAAAVSRGMAASPFGTTPQRTLVLIVGTTRHVLKGCLFKDGDSRLQHDEFDVPHVRTLDVHIPNSLVPTAPDAARDAIEYAGRSYKLTSIAGDAAHSPVWVIRATPPFA